MNKLFQKTGILLYILLTASSCGPVHRFTRIKKIPREYALNFCGDEIKAPKTDLNKEPWIVFSDREKNMTYSNAGAKVKAKDIDYLDPFLVLKKKGDYLQLIKYTPDILKNKKLDYRKAEYYGWIHKSKLLLNQQSVTDIATGKKNKMLVTFSNTTTINEPEKYFKQDSVKVFKDPRMQSVSTTITPYSIIYQMKQSDNGTMTLIARKPLIKAEEAKQDILGWIDHSLIRDIGTGLHANTASIPKKSIQFIINGKKKTSLTKKPEEQSRFLADQYKTIQYNPIFSYSTKNSSVVFRTSIPMPVFDTGDNYIFTVNGNQMSHKKYKELTKELKKINITFVFEGKEQTIAQLPQLVNTLQNLQPLFEQPNDSFFYRFSCVMTFDETNKTLRPVGTDLNEDYASLMNYLSDKVSKKDKLKPLKLTRPWSGLHQAIDSFDDWQGATNLIVLLGETGSINEIPDDSLKNKLLRNNCRILGFQLYAGQDNAYNNFVLNMETMINSYAQAMIKTKQDILVSPEQVKKENHYKELPEAKNGFRLDFPDNSVTQGFILFPKKGETLPMRLLSNNVDTLVQQIKTDNNNIITLLSRAFGSAGNNRTKYDSLFVLNFGLNATKIPSKKMINSFKNSNPGWYLPSKDIVLNKNANKKVKYHLLVLENELNELKEFIETLSSQEVDFKYQTEATKKNKKACNCSNDNIVAQQEKISKTATKIPREYADTKHVRKNLYKHYMKTIKYYKPYKEKNSVLKTITIAEAQHKITGCPTFNTALQSTRVKDIENKKIVSDKMLHNLIKYFKDKKNELDKAEKFDSNEQTYYWVDQKLLP